MKILKRLGKKIKKGVKKLFSSKIGRIVGMIGLSMVMGYAAKALMTGMQGAAPVVADTGTKALADTVAKTGTKALSTGVAKTGEALTTASTPLLEEITVSATKRPVLESIATASTNSEAMAPAMEHMMSETVASNGMVNPDALSSVHNNITSAVEQELSTTYNPKYQNSLASENLFATPPTDGTMMGYQPGTYETYSSTGGAATTATTTTPQTTSLLDPTDFSNLKEGASITDVYPETGRGEWWKTRADAAAKDLKQGPYTPPLGERIRNRFAKYGTDLKESFDTPGKITGEVLQGTATGAAMSAIMGEEEVYGRGQVMPQADMVGPKAAYIQDITPSFREATNTNIMPTFTQLQKAPLYGKGTPQWLQMFEDQNLLMPSMLGIQLPYRSV